MFLSGVRGKRVLTVAYETTPGSEGLYVFDSSKDLDLPAWEVRIGRFLAFENHHQAIKNILWFWLCIGTIVTSKIKFKGFRILDLSEIMNDALFCE